MKLKVWRLANDIKQWRLAEMMTEASAAVLGEPRRVTQQTVQAFETHRVPRRWHMKLIWVVCGGQVGPLDFYELPEIQKPGIRDQGSEEAAA